jgi:aldehyde:ferredoxin oxidoreductase
VIALSPLTNAVGVALTGGCFPIELKYAGYYTERGWDINTGTPTRERLKQLGLEYVADSLWSQ